MSTREIELIKSMTTEWTDLHLAGRRDDQEDPHGGRQEVVALGRHPWSRRPWAPVSRVRHPHMLSFTRPRPSQTTQSTSCPPNSSHIKYSILD